MTKPADSLHLTSITLISAMTLILATTSQAALFERDNYFPEEQLPRESRVPGGIALIPFTYKTNDHSIRPEVYFQGNRVMVLETAKDKWRAVVGLSLKLKPGEHAIEIVQQNAEKKRIPFAIQHKEYEAQYITLKNKDHVTPPEETLKRIRQEGKTMRKAFANWRNQNMQGLKMRYPTEGPLSSMFGLKRYFNKQPRNPHSGLDIAAPQGSPITSPLAGQVTAVGEYYFNGNTVLLDHGQGLVSMYCHLEETAVEKGQQLEAGAQIGKVGSTGRVTGPHLHWSINLNNTRVDPLLFLPPLPKNSNTVADGKK